MSSTLRSVARSRANSRSSSIRQLLDSLAADEVPFGDWLKQVTPAWEWDWPHLAHIRTHLDRVTRGECRRLLIFCPPRHGKTEQTTVRYPVWRLEREPQLRVIV